MSKIDVVAGSFDLLCLQEVQRGVCGWDENQTDCFAWFTHRDAQQWRGVGIGVAKDLFDAVTDKVACGRGAAWVVRLKNHKRLILCSLHCPTGVTVAKYHKDVQDFKQMLRKWHPDLPIVAGVDVNEPLGWNSESTEDAFISSGAKTDRLLEVTSSLRLRAVLSQADERHLPTQYSRDECREGRHIDAVFVRLVGCGSVRVRADMRLEINTDHAMMELLIEVAKTKPSTWVDTRPRWVVRDCDALPPVRNFEDIKNIVGTFTAPLQRRRYCEDAELKDMISTAKRAPRDEKKELWKRVHHARRHRKRVWQQKQITNILYGNWGEYRDYKHGLRKASWWGGLLSSKTSTDVAAEVQDFLGNKLWDVARNWDVELRHRLAQVACQPADLVPVNIEEINTALHGMKNRSAVGADRVCVDLLRRLAVEQPVAMCDMCTEILAGETHPDDWGVSLLALLPKCQTPSHPKDLRPIAMGSAAMKMMSRLVMGRGKEVAVNANRGIRQGSPESAELFGMIVAHELQSLRLGRRWKCSKAGLKDMPVDVGCFQDDIFLWGDNADKIEKNIQLIAIMLANLGLSLSSDKTCIVTNAHYKGRRTLLADGEIVQFRPLGSSVRVLGVDFDFD
ncbi:unnamed protein product, partial [Symbiodinium sp. CCMP2456]